MRGAVPAKVKLAAKIRYLATWVTYSDLQYTFRIHKSTLSRILPEVCDAILRKIKRRLCEGNYKLLMFTIFNIYLTTIKV